MKLQQPLERYDAECCVQHQLNMLFGADEKQQARLAALENQDSDGENEGTLSEDASSLDEVVHEMRGVSMKLPCQLD